MQVGALRIYPVKGARGLDLEAAASEPEGLAGDRRWMIVDEHACFVSQRELHALALLDAQPDPDGLHLSFPGAGEEDGGERFVATPDGTERLTVRIWNDEVDAALASDADNAALSRWLGRPLRLVRFDEASRRAVSRDWVEREAPVAFGDGFPILVATSASLRELNRRIVTGGGEAVPMNRFRPNLVVDGAEPFAEDGWATIRAGDVVFDLVKPCARCVVTTVDQDTGARAGKEPLAALGRSRRSADPRAPGALFGWNAVPRGPGTLRVGDAVEVVARREGGWPIG